MYKNRPTILIPGIKTYKAVDIETGNVVTYKQNINELIHDILIFDNDKSSLLFRIEDKQLTFFITSKCNHRCIMCPQKLNIDASNYDLIIRRVIDNLDYEVIDGICFTGGEPLLKMDFINDVVLRAPENILVTILTNGSIFPSDIILKSPRCKLCIPLYASYDELHNYMTGSNSFYKVIENLMKISQYDTLIELRYVLTKQNIEMLQEFARFTWRNLPFVQDVAFMGMELTAEALINKDLLWINPNEYIPDLQKAVEYLNDNGVTTWIYNLPYCLFDEKYRKFLIPSISTWKVRYLDVCNDCKLKNTCGGMFFSDIKDFNNIIKDCIK